MRLVTVPLCFAAFAAAAFAQAPNPRNDWANLNRLPVGTEVRVALANGKTHRGFLQSATADSLLLNATTSQESVARTDVRRVQQKRKGHRGRNTLIGLGIGLGGGLIAGAAIDSKISDDWFPNAGKAVLTPVGAVIGTVIGVAIPTGGWRQVYPAK